MDNIISLDKLTLFAGIFFIVCILVIIAIMLDLWDGVYTAKKINQPIHSHKLRVTIDKMSEYFRFALLGFLVDCLGLFFPLYPMPVIAILFGGGLLVVEIKSMFEHAARRKSHTTQLPEIIKNIIDCAQAKDARKLIEQIQSLNQETH